MMLAEVLGELPGRPGAEKIQSALARFSASRRPVLRYYSWISRILTHFFQSDHDSLAIVRDVGLPILYRIGLIRREMLRGVVGVKSGLLGRGGLYPRPRQARPISAGNPASGACNPVVTENPGS